ncbi:MAG: hypothetical protein RIR21_1321 [Pseudomonadota bacterium]|jgi:hypothetical protein
MHISNNLERDFHSEFMNIGVILGVPGALFFSVFFLYFCTLKKSRVEYGQISYILAYPFLMSVFLRLLIESVGGVGMYLSLLMLLAAIAAEANRAFTPI